MHNRQTKPLLPCNTGYLISCCPQQWLRLYSYIIDSIIHFNCACAADPHTCRLSPLTKSFDAPVAFFYSAITVKMYDSLWTDRLALTASNTFLLIGQYQAIFFILVNRPFRACLHTNTAMYAARADILLEIFFYHLLNRPVTSRILFFRRMMRRDTCGITCITTYTLFFIKCYLHTFPSYVMYNLLHAQTDFTCAWRLLLLLIFGCCLLQPAEISLEPRES